MSTPKRFIIDIETDDIKATKLWMVAVKEIDTQNIFVWSDHTKKYGSIAEFLDWYKQHAGTSIFIGHNIISFDFPILKRLVGIDYNIENIRDTLVMSRLANQEREGGHSLENWGQHLGVLKGSFSDFSKYSEEMMEYCVQDLRVTERVYERLLQELKGFSMRSLRLEQKVAQILQKAYEKGFKLDYQFTSDLLSSVTSVKDKLAIKLTETTPPLPKVDRLIKYSNKYKKDGTLSSLVTRPLGEQAKYLEGDCSFLEWVPFNPGSREQVAWQLILKGWKPTKFTATGRPQVDEETLLHAASQLPEAKDISEYFTMIKREGQIKSWLELFNEETGRVHGRILHIGARTHRAAHRDPNMAQVPASRHDPATGKLLWGLEGTFSAECRKCWHVPTGYKQVGVDASAIQLVILAHTMGDEEYAKAVAFGKKANGTDIHTVNLKVLQSILSDVGVDPKSISRDTAKKFIYAFLLGAGAGKIEQILGLPKGKGMKAKEEFLSRTPALKRLLDSLEEQCENYGYIRGLDGRRFPCQDPHFALAYVLQGFEQTIMKLWICKLDEWFEANSVPASILTWVHDELQLEVKDVDSWPERVAKKAVELIEECGKELNLKCFLTGESKIGNNWQECH